VDVTFYDDRMELIPFDELGVLRFVHGEHRVADRAVRRADRLGGD
jgi:hypothetical protein